FRESRAVPSGAATPMRARDSSSLPHGFHRSRIVRPMEFELVCKRSRQAVEIGKEGRLSDVHPIQLAHALFTNFFRRENELDQRAFRFRIFLQNFFNRSIQYRWDK